MGHRGPPARVPPRVQAIADDVMRRAYRAALAGRDLDAYARLEDTLERLGVRPDPARATGGYKSSL